MKRKLLVFALCLSLSSVASAKSLNFKRTAGLRHIEGFQYVGVGVYTGWGDSFTVDATYGYLFHNRFSVFGTFSYERGHFRKSVFQSFDLKPGVEGMAWSPVDWFYLHFNAGVLVSYDMWRQKDFSASNNGFGMGVFGGVSFDFYINRNFSIAVKAEQDWRYTWLKDGGYNYFSPLFGVSFRYNIRTF